MIIWKKDSKSEIAKPNIYLMPSLTRSVGIVKIKNCKCIFEYSLPELTLPPSKGRKKKVLVF